MKAEKAMQLIADQMEWDHRTAALEFQELELMVNYKYDHYQGFHSGSRFYLAFIGWLNQFSAGKDRTAAYGFLKRQLIFFSQREVHHLISLLMPIVDRELRKEVAEELKIPLFQTWLGEQAKKRVELKRIRTLFIALSDGARIDVFRRYNEGLISNEQVLASGEISTEKWDDLNKNLKKTLTDSGYSECEAYFERVCLIDDFTGSGSSLIRYDEKDAKWKGKIKRFSDLYDRLMKSRPEVIVQIHHHLASMGACTNSHIDLEKFEKTQAKFKFFSTYSYTLPDEIVINDQSAEDLVGLLTRYYDTNVEDEHTHEVRFGYRKSGLPLVLDHNTPNNSVALLWAESDANKEADTHSMKPLFIRRKRHSSHG